MIAAEQFHVHDVSPSYWRVTFDNGPVNLMVMSSSSPRRPTSRARLRGVITRCPARALVTRLCRPGGGCCCRGLAGQ